MASGGAEEEEDGGIPLDIDNVHMLLQVEHEQIQKRTFTNWVNAQLAKRCPPSYVSDLFSDLKDGSQLLDLLEVMSGQSMKRQRGRGVFQQRANIETALNFIKKKSIKLVNINIPDILDGRPTIILGLIWTIILHCHIEELASALSFSSRHSSLDSLSSLDSWSGSPVPASPVPAGRTSPLHRRFRISAKKALLMWVRDQCQKVHCSVSVKDFKSSWRSGEAFLAILCSLRPQLVDLSLVRSRSNQENLEEAFHLAEQELHIPRLLDPQDVDVKSPDEKSIMTYVAQFLQYSNDMPAPDDHLQVSQSERAQEVTCWLQQAYQELSEAWAAAERSSYAEKHQVFQSLAGSFTEQRRPVMTLFGAIRRCPELSQEQETLKMAWDCLEEELKRCKADLDLSLPPPLDSVVAWLQRAEAVLKEEGGKTKDHADAAKEARTQQDNLKTLIKEMNHYVKILDTHHNTDDVGNVAVPPEKLEEIKNRLTSIRITAKYEGIKLEYQESLHTVLDLLRHISAKVQTWKAPCKSQEHIRVLVADWHETIERQGLILILMDALQNLRERANSYTSKASLGEDSQRVTRQVKEAESETELVKQAVTTSKRMMERAESAWKLYNSHFTSLQAWLPQMISSEAECPAVKIRDMSECHAQLNEVGNFLIEVTETTTRLTLAEQLSKINIQWAECMKKTVFEVPPEQSIGASCLHMVHSLTQEASLLIRQPLEVASVPLKASMQKLQSLRKKMAEVDVSPFITSPDFQTSRTEKLQQTLPQMLAEAERTCGELQRAASRLEGRLAELDHWNTDALDCYDRLKEKMHKRRSALESSTKVLISRGLELVQLVVTEGHDLQDFVTRQKKTSPLQHLSTTSMKSRVSTAVFHTQDILEKFSSIGFHQQVGEFPEQQLPFETVSQTPSETGAYVVARTKHVDQIGSVMLQTQDLNQISSHMSHQRGLQVSKRQHTNTEDKKEVAPRVVVKMISQPSKEPVQQSFSQTSIEAECQLSVQLQSCSESQVQASGFSQNAMMPTTLGIKCPESPALSTHAASSVMDEKQCFQNIHHKSRVQTNPSQSPTSPLVMICSEVHSKAQSMARSRLEKARLRLQGSIHQAIKLFDGKKISESQAKKKQKALKILQPAMLEEFLGAVEGFGAFCSEPQLQDLMLLSDSVRKQWEDVRREIAAFVHALWSIIREGKPSFSVVQCDTSTNTLHEDTDQTDHDYLQQQQQVLEGPSMEQHVETLRELCETLTPRKSSSLETQQLTDEVQEAQTSDTALLPERGQQPEGNTLLSSTSMSADTQLSTSLLQKQSVDGTRQLSPEVTSLSVQHGDILQLQRWEIPAESKNKLMQSKGCRSEQKQKSSLRAKEQVLKARLLQITESSPQSQTQIQAVVRSNTVESKQEAQWTFIPARTAPSQVDHPSEQEAPERMMSLEKTAVPVESVDVQKAQIKEKLNQITRQSVDITSLTLAESTMFSDLKEMGGTLQAEIRKLSEQRAEEEKRGPETTSPSSHCQALYNNIHQLEQLRQQLEEVQSAGQALDHFLASLRDIKAQISNLLANQDPSRQKKEGDLEQEGHSWQAIVQELQPAMEQADVADSSLKAVGMIVIMDGAIVTCQDVVKSVSLHVVEKDKEYASARRKLREQELLLLEKKTIQDSKELKTCSTPSVTEEEAELEAKRNKQEGEREQEQKAQTWRSVGDTLKTSDQRRQRRSSQIKKEAEEKESIVQRTVALLATLRETKEAAEQLRLQEPTLPALQQRTRALTELESHLACLLSEVQFLRNASSQSGTLNENQTKEMEDLWEKTTRTVSERLEQSTVLTKLLKRFQSVHGELNGTLQRAESTISEQASYMGKDNLQKLHTKIRETKAELSNMGDDIEEVRSICRQLHFHLRQVPGCTTIPFESEADGLMDRWLDLSERTDSHLENLHLCLTLWEGVLQLGTEVGNWTDSKLTVFAQCPSFQTEDDIKVLQNEITNQEENIQHFHRRATEIQSLLQSSEAPLELQVVETQMRKKIEQLKELASEAEDFCKQMVSTKGQITGRMVECLNSLQKIQEALLTLTGPDVATVLAKLKELCWQLHTQDEQAESLMEDVQVLASIAGPENLQSLSVSGIQLQEKVKNTHELFSEVEEQTERNIKDLDRLQTEKEYLEQWLHTTKKGDLSLLQEKVLQQSVRTELLGQLVSSLRSSNLQQSALLEQSCKLLEQYHNLHSDTQGVTEEKRCSQTREIEVFRVLSKSTQSWIKDLRQTVDSPLIESHGIQTPVEQRLHCVQAVQMGITEGETRLEELRVNGNSLSQRLFDRNDLKQEVQETIQKTEEQWRDLLQSVQPYYRAIQADPELTSLYLARRREAWCRVKELQHRTDQLPTFFPWPGAAERAQACRLAHQLLEEFASLQLTLTSLDEQRKELAEKTSNNIWKDSSWTELDTLCSALMAELKGLCSRLEEGGSNEEQFGQLLQDCHDKLTSLQEKMSVCQAQKESSAGVKTDVPALEALLRDLIDIEKDLLQLVTLKDSVTVSSIADTHVSLSQQVNDLQNHKIALESSIRDHLAKLKVIQRVEEEATYLQTALRDLTENVGSVSQPETYKVLPGICHLKQQWCIIKDCDKRLTVLAARVNDLHRTRESITTQESTTADVISTVSAVLKDLDSLQSFFLLKKQEFIKNTAETVIGVINQLQWWSQTLQIEPSSPSQVALDEGLQLQQVLQEVLSEHDFLLDCLGAEVAVSLETTASSALTESQPVVHTLSNHLNYLGSKDNSCTLYTEMQSSMNMSLSGNNTKAFISDSPRTLSNTQQANIKPLQRDSTSASALVPRKSLVDADNTKEIVSAPCVTSLNEASLTQPKKLPNPTTHDVSELLAAPSKTFKAITDGQKQEQCTRSSQKVFSIMLELQTWDIQQSGHFVTSDSDVCGWSQENQLCEAKSEEAKKKSRLSTTSISPKSSLLAEPEEVKSESAKLPCNASPQTPDLDNIENLTFFKSYCTVAESQLTGAHGAETTFSDGKQDKMTDFCHSGEQTVSSVCTLQTGDSLHETQRVATDNKQMMAAETAQNTDTACEEVEKREIHDTKCTDSNRAKAASGQDSTSLLQQIEESMEPERTAVGFPADLGAGEMTGGSPESCKYRSTMQDILSEIQNLVEKSNIINRIPHTDLNWYLKSSPSEADIQLVRTIQQVLACRYQPAQLSVAAMTKQLEEAQEHRCRVLEQAVTMESDATMVSDPNPIKRTEKLWSAALLDASATMQVKAAQLNQVKQYHLQMKMSRAFLEVVAAEKEQMSLNSLGSSALQAEKLNALLQTMENKKSLMGDLLCLSSQLSVHLNDAESSGALLAQLGDVQEEWRLLEGSIKRALRHASNSTSQSLLLLKEAEQLKTKLEALQKSKLNNLSALELFCLTTDLKIYNQLYVHLQSQSDALINFSVGQKEKDEIEHNLKELGSLLSVLKRKFDSCTYSCGGISSSRINKQIQDLIIWAKQAENHIFTGQKLALFPEEARIQITEMRKCQTDILSRRTEMQEQLEKLKGEASNTKQEDSEVLKTVEDLYEAVTDSLDHVLDTMKKNLGEREKLLFELASLDAWLAETHAKRDTCIHVESVSEADIRHLESELKGHKLATVEIENQLNLLEVMSESCMKIAIGLSPGESRYLVNRLAGLWTELDGLLAHEKATSWELEELIHEWTSSNEELSTIQASLKQISTDLEQQKFPLTQETLLMISHLKHMLMEHQCQVQELQHCQEAKRNSLLCSIGELQDKCKSLSIEAFEQDKYLHLREQMEESRDIIKGQIQHAQNKAVSVGERFRLCQTLLVELPLVKTQCQEAADQLEAISNELHPSELISERERIHCTVETLVSWENSVTDDIKSLEAKLLMGLRFNSELPAFMKMLQSSREKLEGAEPVNPEEKAIDIALQQYWVIWRNVESGMRVLEGLAQKEKVNLRNYKELYFLREGVIQECHSWMASLSQARESLKDYQWAAQGAIGFLLNAEATFLSAPGGFLDCTEEQSQTQQALQALEDGFQAHICHLVDRVPQQTCLSGPNMEGLHIGILSQLLVGRAVLEAQAQLRLECLQRCEIRQQSHRKCHESIRQLLSELETRLSECAAEQVTSYDKCVAQQRRAKLLMEDLRSLTEKIEDLRAGCPMQGCGVGKDGELGALWRRWASLRRGFGLLMAHTEQRREEWRDITTSMEQCCSFLASLQAEVPDSSIVSFTQEEPQELLAQAEMYQAGLEQEQQAILSLEHRLEHALSLSTSHDSISPGHVGKTLMKIQENVRSLKERNLLIVAAAQAETKERQQIQEEIGQVEKELTTLSELELCLDPSERQKLKKDLWSLKSKVKCIMDNVQSRYEEIPADIGKQIQEVQQSLQKAEEMQHINNSNPVKKLANRVKELGSGLERVEALLQKKSPTVTEAQNVLKHVWDELDGWHSSLMLLESEVQDLAEELPNEAQLLIDQLTEPLQLYQNAAHMAEHRTAFLSKIPACLQEFEDILHRAACWLDEAESWLSTPCSFTTTRSLQNHTKSLQLVLDDSERIRHTLQDFRSMLAEISSVCDMNAQKERLNQSDQKVHEMQRNIIEPLKHLLQATAIVEVIEADLKTMEKNVSKIQTILSSMDVSNISLAEHLQNRQVILASLRSMQSGLEDIERCKGELHISEGAEDLLVFSRARLLLQSLDQLEKLTQDQVSLLESEVKAEEDATMNLGIAPISDSPEKTEEPGKSALRSFDKQAFEVSGSEEEEDEECESCHSSSSDTLTCSVAEDPEETINLSDEQSEHMAEMKDLQSSAHQISSEAGTSSKGAVTSLRSQNVETGLIKPDLKVFSPKTVKTDSANSATIPPAEAAGPGPQKSPKQETVDPQKKACLVAAAVEDTRLIPSRPVTPFSTERASDEFREEDEDLSLSTTCQVHSDTVNRMKEQQEVSTCHSSLVDIPPQTKGLSDMMISLAGHEDHGVECQSWGQLYSQISLKLSTLRRIHEESKSKTNTEAEGEDDKPQGKVSPSTGSVSAVLRWTHESITMLRLMVRTSSSHQRVKEELFQVVRRFLLCLDSLADFLLTPAGAGEDDPQLRLLQLECVSTELLTLAELVVKVESEIKPALLKGEPDAYRCLSIIQDCLQTAQPVLTSSYNQLIEQSGFTNQHQDFSNQLCLLDEFKLQQTEIFPDLKDAPSLECVLGKHLRKRVKAKLQHASRAVLQGIARLLEVCEECLTERPKNQVPSRSKLQSALCRNKKLLKVLMSQLAFVHYLFQQESNALKSQEDERAQLEVRAKALQQKALEQEVASQMRLQEWICWEEHCGQLGKILDESEAFISSGAPVADGDERQVQHRMDACKQTLDQLDECRAVLELVLDQGKALQTEPGFAAAVSQAGGALELRWRNTYRRIKQEIQRCKDIQDSRARFQTEFASVSEWLLVASKHLKSLPGLADSSDLSEESVQRNLVKLLDFSMEVEAMSVLRTSVSKDATQLIHLMEADCPGLRAQLTQLEVSWNQITFDLSKIQDHLQQGLQGVQQPLMQLSELEDWMKKIEARLSQEKEQVLKVKNATQITEILQNYQVLISAMAKGQLLLDFLSQSGSKMVRGDIQALWLERTMFAEKFGTVRFQWLLLQRELESQTHEAEQIHHTCAERERRLQSLHGWLEQQKKQLNQWKQTTSQTQASKALRELEAGVSKVEEVLASLLELTTKQVHDDKEKKHPSDVAFAEQAESVSLTCVDLIQQMEALKPTLQKTVEEWTCFHRGLRDVTVHATRVRSSLQHFQAPFFSLKQTEGYLNLLQDLLVKAAEGEKLWMAVDKSYQGLLETLHHGAAEALGAQVEKERKRWNDTAQEIKDEHIKTGRTLSLWRDYTHLADSCPLHLQHLWHEWEELSSPSLSPEKDKQAMVCSVKKLQDAIQELQSNVGVVLEESKPLLGQLEPLSANLIQSNNRLLSRDILLLNQAILGKRKSFEENFEQQKLFQTRLEAFKKQMQTSLLKLKAGRNDTDSLKEVVLELSDLFPLLVDIVEMSAETNKQETEKLHTLSRWWVESLFQASDINRELHHKLQRSHNFEEKCNKLKCIQEKLEQESMCRKPPTYSNLQEMLAVHQGLQAEIIIGHELLRGLLSDAVESIETEMRQNRSELMHQVTCIKKSWSNSVTLAGQNRTMIKEGLHCWKIYRHGLKLLRKMFTAVDSLLPPTGPCLYTLHQLQNFTDVYQCVEKCLGLHFAVYTQTVEAGKHLCETITVSECQSQLRSELQDLEETWEQTSSLLRKSISLANTTDQMWTQCQVGISNIVNELDQVKKLLAGRPEESEELIQETEFSLQHLASGLKELATMKTDLSQYVAASDSILLEQQLEQLHSQWEELCMKVSLRRQEIADHLNAWTIFNDKNKEFCDWLTQMENKVCHSGDLSIEEMVEKLKKDCMEEINLFSENKSHLKQLGEQLLLASDEAKQTQVHGSLQEVSQRWHNLFHHIEARVKKLKETLVTVQQLDKNMSNLRSWLSRIEAELSRPITYSICHEREIQRRLAEQQELQRDIEKHTEGVASVLSLCDVLLRDEDAAGGSEAESDSLQETSRSLDQRWRTICAMALDRRLRIEETWTLWCKFLNDYSRFEDWLKMAERTAANPNSADVLFTVAKEELKKFEGFQRQVHERLTQLELINNQYRRLARENRTDRASQLKAMVREGNRRWDTLHRRVAAILRRLKYFTSQREDFEGTRESMLVWLTELDLQLTNVEHFSESDVHHKIQQLNSFQKEITLNTERIDGLIVFGEGLIQKSSQQDAALIEDELEELHSYCQEVFSRLVRFHQRLSQPPMVKEEPELSTTTFSLESSLELIGRSWVGRSQGSLPATPTHLLTSPLERSGRETPVSVDSLPLEWDHTGDVGGSSSHEDDEEEEEQEEEGTYFSALSVSSRSMVAHESPRWQTPRDAEALLDAEEHTDTAPALTSTPIKQGYLHLMSQCSGSIENLKRVSLILDDEEQQEEFGLTGLTASDKQSGVIERWELLRAQSRCDKQAGPRELQQLTSELDDITSWLEKIMPELHRLQKSDPAGSIEDLEARARELKEMHKVFAHYKSIMLSVNLREEEAPELQERVASMNTDWSKACTGLQRWDSSLRRTLMRCQEFHETLHSLLLWLANAESRCYSVDINHPETTVRALQQHVNTLTELQEELQRRQAQQASLQALWSHLQPEEGAEESDEAQEKLHVTGSKLKLLLRQVDQDLNTLQQRLDCESASAVKGQSVSADTSQEAAQSKKASSIQRERRQSSPPRSFFYRVLRAAFPLQLLLLLLLLLPCLIPLSESDPSCTVTNNFARSFYPMLRYTNGPPPT
ncbi:nesprin-2-like [Melanotaenia boesemani]|uniref:nesprin-2-like n=1 Tax=Melanotaenia boesemani TaxID=1250792 RepID=UPI001C04F585|nr:nesprin-2-like [Melanotaenia boesemani]